MDWLNRIELWYSNSYTNSQTFILFGFRHVNIIQCIALVSLFIAKLCRIETHSWWHDVHFSAKMNENSFYINVDPDLRIHRLYFLQLTTNRKIFHRILIFDINHSLPQSLMQRDLINFMAWETWTPTFRLFYMAIFKILPISSQFNVSLHSVHFVSLSLFFHIEIVSTFGHSVW